MSPTQKHTNAKAILLALLVLVGMIVSPVCALGYEITAEPLGGVIHLVPGRPTNLSVDVSPQGDAIQRITIDIPTGTVLNFTLWYGNSSTVDGWMEYTNDGFFTQHSEVAIGGDIQGYSYWGIQEMGRIDIIGYARNWTSETEYTSGIMVYDALRISTQYLAYHPVSGLTSIAIYKFEFTSTKPVVVNYYTNTRANVEKAARTTLFEAINEWVQFAIQIASFIMDTAIALFYWLKFFFWDNLGMTVALYISITMAYSANTAKDIFTFFRKFFNDQKKLFEFILSLWTTLINLIAQFRSIFHL